MWTPLLALWIQQLQHPPPPPPAPCQKSVPVGSSGANQAVLMAKWVGRMCEKACLAEGGPHPAALRTWPGLPTQNSPNLTALPLTIKTINKIFGAFAEHQELC